MEQLLERGTVAGTWNGCLSVERLLELERLLERLLDRLLDRLVG